jgi:hypothetical protein
MAYQNHVRSDRNAAAGVHPYSSDDSIDVNFGEISDGCGHLCPQSIQRMSESREDGHAARSLAIDAYEEDISLARFFVFIMGAYVGG